ncbi:MAG: ribonuclease Y [Acidobacteriota bacterium]
MSEPATTATIVGLAVLAAVLAGALFLARRRAAQLEQRLERTRREQETTLRERLRRRMRREEQRLRREIDERRAEVERRAREVDEARSELATLRERLDERRAGLDDRAEELTSRARELEQRARALDEREQQLAGFEQTARRKLEEIAGLSEEQARSQLLSRVEQEAQADVARVLAKADEQARASAEERARELVLEAMAGIRGAVAGEGTISVVRLPSDEMKGRVIGREGRNIRALELATGVDLLVDDTPEAILLSSWDPLRRAIAVRALGKLVEDGRIHPARIEEVVEQTREEADEEARELGEAAAFEVGVAGLHERLVLLLGRLSFLRDHGHSLLARARETALIAGAIADAMRLDGEPLRRAGLLHEVARADKEPLRTHAALASADLAKRFGERAAVTQAIRALAQPPDTPRTPNGVILVTARRMAFSRPGARHENLQRFIDRLAAAEEIALAHEGVERAYAVRAGRELRVHVRAEEFPDERTILLAREIAREIERRLEYPGQVRVLVLRETRAVSYAV